MRPPSRVAIATVNPFPSSWRSRSRATCASSITRSTVDDELRPSFSSSRVRQRELLEDEDVGEEVSPGSAVLLGDAHAEQPEAGQLPQQPTGKAVLAVPRAGVRDDLRIGELPRQRLDLPLVGAQGEIH